MPLKQAAKWLLGSASQQLKRITSSIACKVGHGRANKNGLLQWYDSNQLAALPGLFLLPFVSPLHGCLLKIQSKED